MQWNKKEILSIPNLLSFMRILLIPAFVYSYVTAAEPKDYLIAAGIILLSGLTDLVDGKIARRYHMITEFGKALDPIADKLTQAGIVLSLLFKIKYMYLLVILFIIKELYMGISCLILLRRGKKLNGAKWYGKVCTAVLYIVMFLLIAIPGMPAFLQNTLMLVCAGFMLLSMGMYLPVFIKLYQNSEKI